MLVSKERQREFSDLVLAACRFFGADEATAHKVITLCLEGIENDRAPTQEQIRNTILNNYYDNTTHTR